MSERKGQEVWWCLRDQATGDENHCWRAEAWESQRLGKYAGGCRMVRRWLVEPEGASDD